MTDPMDPGSTPRDPAEIEAETGPAGSGRGLVIGLTVAVVALAAVVAFLLFGGSDDPDTSVTTTPETTLASTTPTTSPATTTPTSSPDTTASATTVPETTVTTEAPTTSTTEPQAAGEQVPAFFMHDSGGRPDRPGPFLAPAARTAGSLEEAIEGMLSQTQSEVDLGLTTAVPEGTTLNGVEVAGGIASVDLSSSFEEGGGSLSMQSRLAQLVFTVTGFDSSITGVNLLLDGEPVDTFSGEGIVLDDPMTRESFQDVTPGILVESPAFDGWSGAPLTVTGIAAAFEGAFQLEILDADGDVVADVPFVQTDNGVGWGNFSVTFDEADLPPMPADLQVRVWENSAEDGSVISERFQPFGYRAEP